MDYTNWDNERAALKAEIFKELREQRDRNRTTIKSGSITIEPQYLTANVDREYGPYPFSGPFALPPHMGFAQYREDLQKPFWGLIDISRWDTEANLITGFYIGFYPIMEPPAGLFRHTISWIAQGTASVYHDGKYETAWSTSYDEGYNSAVNVFK